MPLPTAMDSMVFQPIVAYSRCAAVRADLRPTASTSTTLNQIRNLTTPGRQRGELRLCGLNRWVVLLWDDRYGVNLHERARASVSCGRNAVMGQGTSEPLVYVSAGQGLAHLG